ncbi:restriction endonuclease subunit S [Rahnella aceris]
MSELNYLQKLPNRSEVEWKTLGEIGEVRMCKRILKSQTTSDGEIPFYKIGTFGKKPDAFISRKLFDEFKEKYSYPKVGEILISASGTIGRTVIFDGKDSYFQDSNIVWIENDEKIILNKYLYYFYQIAKWGVSEGGTIQRLYNENIRKLAVPVPFPESPQKSRAEQTRIVRILDAFTALAAELNAELTMRKKQYNYYCEQLLSFDEGKIQWKTLGELAENLDSKRKPITSGLREAGNIPYYGASGIVDYVKDYIFDGDFLLISEDGANLLARNTPIAFSISGKTWVNNHAHVLKFDTYAERRYIEYYLNSIDLTPYISGAAQPKLNKKNLENIRIPNPSLEEKERIVSILDKFDALTNSITEGLPHEIELRQNQYEYYRDLLFTFPKLNVQVEV